jgi:hypothetical protein
MKAKRIDDNQQQLVKQIRRIPGVSVKITSALGEGFTDAVIGFRGMNYLTEIKDPAKPPSARKLTPAEEKFHSEWRGQVCIIETIDDVLKMLKIA